MGQPLPGVEVRVVDAEGALVDTEVPGEAGFTGSLVVAEFPSLEAAQSWADADPYLESGAYRKVAVKPFKLVLP